MCAIKQIDGNTVTFSTIVEQFYEKASKKGFNLRPRLSFLLRFPEEKNIIRKCNEPVKEFLDHTKMLRVQNTVPSLKNDIIFIYNNTLNTRSFYNRIVHLLEYQPPIEADKIFKTSYEKWENDPDIDVARLEEVQKYIGEATSEYDVMYEKCVARMTLADQVKVNIEKYFDSANTSFDSICNEKSTSLKSGKQMVDEAKTIMSAIKQEQKQLFKHLAMITYILEFYTDLRMTVIECIIGLRNSITAEIRNEHEEIDF